MSRPVVCLPDGDRHAWPGTGRELYRILGETGNFYLHNGEVAVIDRTLSRRPTIKVLNAAEAITIFEEHAAFTRAGRRVPLSREYASILLKSNMREVLPVLDRLETSVVLREDSGGRVEVIPSGYDGITRSYFLNNPPPEVDFEDALRLIAHDILGEFPFRSSEDRGRALIGLFAPILSKSGLTQGRIPIRIMQADRPGSGKTYLDEVIAAVYGESLQQITQITGGVGSLDEAFGNALASGSTFIQLDNIRGRLDSTLIEQFATGDGEMRIRLVRVGYHTVDREKYLVSITSNGFEPTPDLLHRSVTVELTGRADGHDYREYPEGDLKAHIRTHQPLYMGAVVAIIKEWHSMGASRTQENRIRSGFRDVVRVCDAIAQDIFRFPPILDNHDELVSLMATPDMNWLVQVCRAVERNGDLDCRLTTTDIAEILRSAGVPVPTVRQQDLENIDRVRKAIGSVFGQLFSHQDESRIQAQDYYVYRWIERTQSCNEGSGTMPTRFYRFSLPQGNDDLRAIMGNLADSPENE